jgi:hypothetical protein
MYATFLITILAESEYTLDVKFDLESVKRMFAETDLNSGSLFISWLPNLSASSIIKFELELVLVESESELCNRGNNTSYIYILGVRLTPERERERESS